MGPRGAEPSPDSTPLLLQVVSTPNSSLVWVQYMAHHLAQGEIAAARETAERALRTISFRCSSHMRRATCGPVWRLGSLVLAPQAMPGAPSLCVSCGQGAWWLQNHRDHSLQPP